MRTENVMLIIFGIILIAFPIITLSPYLDDPKKSDLNKSAVFVIGGVIIVAGTISISTAIKNK